MRKIVLGTAVLAGTVLTAVAAEHLPRAASAFSDQTPETIDVLKLEETIGTKALPQQEISLDVYQ